MRFIARASSIFISLSTIALLLPACAVAEAPDEPIASTRLALGAQAPNTILILDSTVQGGMMSKEATDAVWMGFNVELATAADWNQKTTADFKTYRAIVLGDVDCTKNRILTAEQTRFIWSPAVTGNVIIAGTDPGHAPFGIGNGLTRSAIGFAADDPANTGAYISLSCYYSMPWIQPNTAVEVLDQFGTFEVEPVVGYLNDAHMVATHLMLNGPFGSLTDSNLSNWHPSSARETFDTFPPTFIPFVIAENAVGQGALSFPDGSSGLPYILVRGAQPSLCGNGQVDPGEQCDDGDYLDNGTCSSLCETYIPYCGNGVIDPGEECEPCFLGNWCTGDCLIDYANIPPLTGACCLAGGGCEEGILSDDCASGVFLGGGQTCVDFGSECPAVPGACCTPEGDCLDGMQPNGCDDFQGSFHGTGTSCADNGLQCNPPNPASGACCLLDGFCLDGMQHQGCDAKGGSFLGLGTSCATDGLVCEPPPPVSGACCLGEGCAVITPQQCAQSNGVYTGNSTVCGEETCPGCTQPTGACCVEGQCLVLTEAACFLNGGLYASDESVCTSNTCDCDDGCDGGCAPGCSVTAVDPRRGGAPYGLAALGALGLGLAARRRRAGRATSR